MRTIIDGIAERIRPGQKREPVLAAWGFTASGAKVLLHLMAVSKEDAETVSAFFQDMRGRGLGDPLLVVCDGAAGIIKAIETCFPRSERQRCLAHRMRNLAAKVPEDRWPEFKARATAAYQAPSRAIGRDLAAGLVKDYEAELPSAVACFMDDFRNGSRASENADHSPPRHQDHESSGTSVRRGVEERRRLKIIPNAFGEKPVLKLMFGAMIRAAERWRAIRITDFERRQMTAVRQELDQEYEARNGLNKKAVAKEPRQNLSSSSRT
nr:transposase [Mesorhizobium sp.]